MVLDDSYHEVCTLMDSKLPHFSEGKREGKKYEKILIQLTRFIKSEENYIYNDSLCIITWYMPTVKTAKPLSYQE